MPAARLQQLDLPGRGLREQRPQRRGQGQGADPPARGRRDGIAGAALLNHQQGRAAAFGRKLQAPSGHAVKAAELGDHDGHLATARHLLQRPENVAVAGDAQGQDPGRIKPQADQPWRIGQRRTDPGQRAAVCPLGSSRKPPGQRQSKTRRRRRIPLRAVATQAVQASQRQPATRQGIVKRRNAKGEYRRAATWLGQCGQTTAQGCQIKWGARGRAERGAGARSPGFTSERPGNRRSGCGPGCGGIPCGGSKGAGSGITRNRIKLIEKTGLQAMRSHPPRQRRCRERRRGGNAGHGGQGLPLVL